MASQILKSTSAQLEQVFSSGDVTVGNVAVVVTAADGTVISSGNAAHVGSTGSGTYVYTLAPQAELNLLTVTWTGTWTVAQTITSYAEIVGANLFALADLRAFGDRVLADTVKYPDEALREARERITDLFQHECNVSFIPRYGRDTLDGNGDHAIRTLGRRVNRVIAASISGTALTSGELADLTVRPSGLIFRKSGIWTWALGGRNVVIAYEHGYPTPPPDVQFAGLMLARYELVSSDLSDRALSFTSDFGIQTLVTAGGPMRNPTNLPIVNETLMSYSETPLMVA